MDIEAQVTPELEAELVGRAPWMHRYRLAPDVIVGNYKYHGIQETACVSTSPPELVARMQAAYDDYRAGDPEWQIRELAGRLDGLRGKSILDIASASGRFSLALAANGADDVLGVEIRPEQVEQAELIRAVDAGRRFDGVRFEHCPTSADDPAFLAGRQFDVVLSMGLLYHVTQPVAHIHNVRRLARQAALVHTMTHARDRGYWLLVEEEPGGITKAWEGIAWVPHHEDVRMLLLQAGFSRVDVIASSEVAALQRFDRRRSGWERAVLPGAASSALERVRSRRYGRLAGDARRRYVNPRFYTYLATT
jgi:SAM-dependent methyltransferase